MLPSVKPVEHYIYMLQTDEINLVRALLLPNRTKAYPNQDTWEHTLNAFKHETFCSLELKQSISSHIVSSWIDIFLTTTGSFVEKLDDELLTIQLVEAMWQISFWGDDLLECEQQQTNILIRIRKILGLDTSLPDSWVYKIATGTEMPENILT